MFFRNEKQILHMSHEAHRLTEAIAHQTLVLRCPAMHFGFVLMPYARYHVLNTIDKYPPQSAAASPSKSVGIEVKIHPNHP